MIDIDEKWLSSLGVSSMNKAQLEELLKLAEDELEMRVGRKIWEKLTDEQVAEFEAIGEDMEDQKLEWLEKAYPEYKKVVGMEYKAMSSEIKKAKDKTALIKSWAVS